MAWVSPKVYAILSQNDEGKDIIEDLPNMSQEECDRRLDDFFGNDGSYKSENENEKESVQIDEEAKKSAEHKDSITRAFTNYGMISGSKECVEKFRKALESREVLDPELEYMIAYCAREGFGRYGFGTLYLRKNQSSVFVNDNWKYGSYIQIGGLSDATNKYIVSGLAHEVGHAMDYDRSQRRYRSSSFISPKYGVSLQDMIQKKMAEANVDEIKGIIHDIVSKRKEINHKRARREIYIKQYLDQIYDLEIESGSIEDIVEANLGDKVPEAFGHGKSYWKDDKESVGTELFAEITESRIGDKNRGTIKFLEKYAPECLEIYDEIISELKKGIVSDKKW